IVTDLFLIPEWAPLLTEVRLSMFRIIFVVSQWVLRIWRGENHGSLAFFSVNLHLNADIPVIGPGFFQIHRSEPALRFLAAGKRRFQIHIGPTIELLFQ